MAVKNIRYVWDISNINMASSRKRSPLFPENEKNQWYLELVENGNLLTAQLHQNDPNQNYIIQNLNISMDPEIEGSCTVNPIIHPIYHTVCTSKFKYKSMIVSFQVKEELNYNQLMLDDEEFSDFTIVVQDHKIAVHKIILATRSPVFYAMLKHNLQEKSTNSTHIIDFDKETISALIKFIYTGKIDLISDNINVKNLLAAADKYEVKDLQLRCENYLVQKLEVSNALEILMFAEQYNFVRLKEITLEFMAKNLSSFSELESLEMLDSYPHLYRTLISKKMKKEFFKRCLCG